MLGLARSSTVASLKEDIEELEDENSRLERSRDNYRRKKNETYQAKKEAERALTAALEHGEFADLKDKKRKVETLDEPRVAWKRGQNYVIELVIPAGERVVHPFESMHEDNKKRVSKAYVRQFYWPETGEKVERRFSSEYDRSFHRGDFIYKEGKFVTPNNNLDTDTCKTCTSGIHCFATREEAENYW